MKLKKNKKREKEEKNTMHIPELSIERRSVAEDKMRIISAHHDIITIIILLLLLHCKLPLLALPEPCASHHLVAFVHTIFFHTNSWNLFCQEEPRMYKLLPTPKNELDLLLLLLLLQNQWRTKRNINAEDFHKLHGLRITVVLVAEEGVHLLIANRQCWKN